MNIDDIDPDKREEADIEAIIARLREEADLLEATIPQARERQWDRSPVPRAREEAGRSPAGGAPNDPTADAALDPRRMAVRATVRASRDALLDAVVALRGSRLAMERKIRWYDGE